MTDPTSHRVACLILLLTATELFAQALPPRPVPVTSPLAPAEPPPVPVILFQPSTPLSYIPPPPPPPAVAVYDPVLDGVDLFGATPAAPGWFFDVQVSWAMPSLSYHITNDMPLPKTGLMLNVPAVDLDSTLAPTIEVGYRLPDCCGLWAFSYGFLASEGTGQGVVQGLDSTIRTRLNLNWFDFDYGTNPYEFAPRWDISYRLGARIANVFFDSRFSNPFTLQQTSNNFFGAGPHARIEIERRILTLPGLGLFGRLDGAALLGEVEQKYRAEFPPGNAGIVDTAEARRAQLVPVLVLQLGASYAPLALPGFKLSSGYEYGQYFDAGRLGIGGTGAASGSKGDVSWQGWFVRGQVEF